MIKTVVNNISNANLMISCVVLVLALEFQDEHTVAAAVHVYGRLPGVTISKGSVQSHNSMKPPKQCVEVKP